MESELDAQKGGQELSNFDRLGRHLSETGIARSLLSAFRDAHNRGEHSSARMREVVAARLAELRKERAGRENQET